MKRYIEVTTITAGMNATNIKQSLAVRCIDAVMDMSDLSDQDRANLGLEPTTKTVIVATSVSDSPCEVTETYEQVTQRIKEASE